MEAGLREVRRPGRSHTAGSEARLESESNETASVDGQGRLRVWVLGKPKSRDGRCGPHTGSPAAGPHGAQTSRCTKGHVRAQRHGGSRVRPGGSRVSRGPEAGSFLLRPQPGWPHRGPQHVIREAALQPGDRKPQCRKPRRLQPAALPTRGCLPPTPGLRGLGTWAPSRRPALCLLDSALRSRSPSPSPHLLPDDSQPPPCP